MCEAKSWLDGWVACGRLPTPSKHPFTDGDRGAMEEEGRTHPPFPPSPSSSPSSSSPPHRPLSLSLHSSPPQPYRLLQHLQPRPPVREEVLDGVGLQLLLIAGVGRGLLLLVMAAAAAAAAAAMMLLLLLLPLRRRLAQPKLPPHLRQDLVFVVVCFFWQQRSWVNEEGQRERGTDREGDAAAAKQRPSTPPTRPPTRNRSSEPPSPLPDPGI